MRRSFIRAAVAAALLSLSVVTPAQAEADAEWVLVRSGTASSAADPATDTVTALVADLLATAGAPACTPRTARLDVYDLRWEEWANSYGDVAYRWFGPGAATVSTDCASRVDVSVQVTDYAPAGRPPVVRGTPNANGSSSPSGGLMSAATEATLWVVYYSPLNLYARGDSLVEIKVSGTYYNTKARATLPLGCVVSYTHVTPTPAGPMTGPRTAPERCPA